MIHEMDDALLREQAAYYRARAPEYDDWWYRRARGRLRTRVRRGLVGRRRTSSVRRFDAFAPRGDVLELAAGTGIWTSELLRFADRVTALDASLRDARDQPRASTATSGSTISRPTSSRSRRPGGSTSSSSPSGSRTSRPSSFASFWSTVADALAPGGRVFFLDGARPDHVDANGPDGRRRHAPRPKVSTAAPSAA